MKTLFIMLILVLSTSFAHSYDCSSVYYMSREISQARYDGMNVIDAMGKYAVGTSDYDIVLKMVVLRVYDAPLYMTEEYKRYSIDEISNHAFISCEREKVIQF